MDGRVKPAHDGGEEMRELMAAERRAYAEHIDGDPADEIVRRKPMSDAHWAGERTGGARQIGSPVKPWKPAIS